MALESKEDDIGSRLRAILGLHDTFTRDLYDVVVRMEGADVVVEVFEREAGGGNGAGAGAGAGVGVEPRGDESKTVNNNDALSIIPGEEPNDENIEVSEENIETLSAPPVLKDITTNYDSVINLLKGYSGISADAKLDYIRNILLPINKQTSQIFHSLTAEIGPTKNKIIDGPTYKAYIMNKLLNTINTYFTDYYLHSMGYQKEEPNKTILLTFFDNELARRKRNGVNVSVYENILSEIKAEPQVQTIISELDNNTTKNLEDVLKLFNIPVVKRRGGAHPNPLRQTRKLRKSNK